MAEEMTIWGMLAVVSASHRVLLRSVLAPSPFYLAAGSGLGLCGWAKNQANTGRTEAATPFRRLKR